MSRKEDTPGGTHSLSVMGCRPSPSPFFPGWFRTGRVTPLSYPNRKVIDMHNKYLDKEIDNAMRINELRNLIKFLVENGMFNNSVLHSTTFKKALTITDEQKHLDNPQGQLWSRPKETK